MPARDARELQCWWEFRETRAPVFWQAVVAFVDQLPHEGGRRWWPAVAADADQDGVQQISRQSSEQPPVFLPIERLHRFFILLLSFRLPSVGHKQHRAVFFPQLWEASNNKSAHRVA